MDCRELCAALEQEARQFEAEWAEGDEHLEQLRQVAEQSRLRLQNQSRAQRARFREQLLEIDRYLKQIPTTLSLGKNIGPHVPLDTQLLTQLAIQANITGQTADYARLHSALLGMMEYIRDWIKNDDAALKAPTQEERAYTEAQKGHSRRDYEILVGQRIIKNPMYQNLVKFISRSRQDLRRFVGPSYLLIGQRYTSFRLPKSHCIRYVSDFGECFDRKEARLLIPYYTGLSRGFKLLLRNCGDLAGQDELVESLLYSLLQTRFGEDYQIQYIDCVRLTRAGVGRFQPLLNQKNRLFLAVPQCEEEVTACLDRVMELCGETERVLLQSGEQSLYTWNARCSPEQRRKRLLLVLEGFPFYFPKREQDRLRQIFVNSDRWGVSVIASVDMRRLGQGHNTIADIIASYGMEGFMKITCPSPNIRVAPCGPITAQLLDSFLIHEEPVKESTRYTDWFDLSAAPDYRESAGPAGERRRLPITLPVGVDEKGQLVSVTFEGMRFAGYLMGAAGSGKSSLIHAMIASILRQYHPDDVELWLVDFKMMEFAQYMENMPPHVKYIVLDYSPKVVCDLLDKITAELTRRTELFFRHPEWGGNIDNVPVSAGLPRIFLIVDEFEKMAKILSNKDSGVDIGTYKRKISSLLQEGRSAGFRVLFSSQNYEAGVNILEDNARNNIGIRIAMKNEDIGEMRSVLNLQGDALARYEDKLVYLPPHQMLIAEKDLSAAKTTLHQLKSLWIPENRDLQGFQAILRERMRPTQRKESGDIWAYIDKKPGVISGKQLNSFEELTLQFQERLERERAKGYFSEDIPVFLGNLQAMDARRPIWLTTEKSQNICLVAPQVYAPYAASIVLSAAKCFEQAGAEVKIIGYRRNPVYARYRRCWDRFACTDEALEADRWLREAADSIRGKSCRPTLIVLCGASEIAEEAQSELTEQAAQAKAREERQAGLRRSEPPAAVQEEGQEGLPEMERVRRIAAQKAAERARPALGGGLQMGRIARAPAPENDEDIWENIRYIQQFGSQRGVHLFTVVGTVQDLDVRSKIEPDLYSHLLSFKIPSNGTVTRLRPARDIGSGDDYADDSICAYSGSETFTFRPFLHRGLTWGDWQVGEDGRAFRS